MRQSTAESRIPTDTFLLPGQQFCVGLPWERANLPKHGLPKPLPKPVLQSGTTLDEEAALLGDPCAGWEIGQCEIIRRLSPGSAKRLLAIRRDRLQEAVVDLCRIELADVLGSEVQTHASWASKHLHPNLARVFPAEVGDEGIFWVTERVSGATLAELIEACRGVGKAVPLGLLLSAVHETALGLTALHDEGHAHGLVSDHSVAVGFDGTARLLDVGLFRCLARRSSWQQVLDLTGPFLSPEQVLQGRLPDPKCDVFSLAMVLYEGLTGNTPRKASGFEERVKQAQRGTLAPPSSLNVVLTRSLDEVVLKGLSSDRAVRYPHAAAFADALKMVAAPFMWRPHARAEFVASMFGTRQRQEQALVAHLAPRRRSSVQLRIVSVADEAARPAVNLDPAPPKAKPARPHLVQPGGGLKPLAAPATKRSKKGKPQRASVWPALAALVVAAGVGFGLARAGIFAPPVAEVKQAAVVAAAPQPAPASPEELVSIDPQRGPPVSTEVTWLLPAELPPPSVSAEDTSSAAAKKTVRAKAKRPKRDDAPLPPWLMARSKRR